MANQQSVSPETWKDTWKRCYSISMAGNKSLYRSRPSELEDWDKPNIPKEDASGKWKEWDGKVLALKDLIEK